MKAVRRAAAVAVALAIATLTSCGGPTADAPEMTIGIDDSPTPDEQSIPGSPDSPSGSIQPTMPPLSPTVVHYEAPDGSRVTLTWSLSTPMRGDDETIAAAFPTGFPCELDSQRDAVFLGTLDITNDTQGFDVSPFFVVHDRDTMSLAVGWSNGPLCLGLGDGAEISPNLQSGSAHVPIAFVVGNMYSPAYPDGNPSAPLRPYVFADLRPGILFAATAVDGIAELGSAASGEVYLNLGKLAF